jgi:hypothetical protein
MLGHALPFARATGTHLEGARAPQDRPRDEVVALRTGRRASRLVRDGPRTGRAAPA